MAALVGIASKLAIEGGKPAVDGPLKPFNTIGKDEAYAAWDCILRGPLSGYLGGARTGGYYVEALEAAWCEIFRCRFAVSCNSATSGLLMASHAAGVGLGTTVATSPFTMSGTVAPATILGATIIFSDIEDEYFCIEPETLDNIDVLITPNIFGHPSLGESTLGLRKPIVIEDNAQAIFAKDRGRYAGTIGHMGVWSLNVHKHIQCGEGGVVTTDDGELADKLRLFRNHGELAGGSAGLNLRMAEVTAAIALKQLEKAEQIVAERIEIAENMTEAMVCGPNIRTGCRHSFYIWAVKIPPSKFDRTKFVAAMNAEGVPLRVGYVEPLYRLPAFHKFVSDCPVAERMQDVELVTYENCAYSPTSKQLKQFREAFLKVVESGYANKA